MTEEDDDIQAYVKPWVGLTDEEIEQLHTAWVLGGGFRQLCNAIEAKLKEKNA
jgi:alkylhydroperoxidase/carboxymuconolactone decarboxylase family protein YurZ